MAACLTQLEKKTIELAKLFQLNEMSLLLYFQRLEVITVHIFT